MWAIHYFIHIYLKEIISNRYSTDSTCLWIIVRLQSKKEKERTTQNSRKGTNYTNTHPKNKIDREKKKTRSKIII